MSLQQTAELVRYVTTSILFGRTIFTIVFLAALVVWFYRRRTLATFVVLFASLLPIGAVYYALWHEGLFFLVTIFVILIAFVRAKDEPRTERDRIFDKVIIGLVVVFLAHHVIWTWRSYDFDINYPYCASKEAAEFIAEHHLDRARLFGAGFSTLAVEPYFDHNVFANYQTYGHFTFWDWSSRTPWFQRPQAVVKMNELRAWMAGQLAQKPDFFLIQRKFFYDQEYERMLVADGHYRHVANFAGGMFWKDHIIEWNTFELFARVPQ